MKHEAIGINPACSSTARRADAWLRHPRLPVRFRSLSAALAVTAGIVMALAGCATSDPATTPELIDVVPITLENPAFESAAGGWHGLVQEASEYWAPVEGLGHARAEAAAETTVQSTCHLIEPGRDYLLTVWAKSLNPPGLGKPTPVEISLLADDQPVATVQRDVSPRRRPPAGTQRRRSEYLDRRGIPCGDVRLRPPPAR